MPWLIVANETRAKNISAALYDLRRPNPDPNDVTEYWIRWVVHSDGRAALDASDAKLARIDPTAIPDAFIDLVKSALTQQEIADAKQVILDARGTRVRLGQIVPDRIKTQLKTLAEMEADGWPVGSNV